MKLSDFINKYGDCEVSEEMEKMIQKPKGKWKPKNNETYWFIDSLGRVAPSMWRDDIADKYRFDFLRIFKTKVEAERYLSIMYACKEASFKPDWNDKDQLKYTITWCRCLNGIDPTCFSNIYNSGCKFYFKSEDIVKELINRFGEKDIAKYVLGVEMED